MASTRNSNRNRTGTSTRSADRTSRTTSRTGAWEQVKQHPILAATAGVLAMGVGAYALMRKNGGRGRRNSD